MGCIARLLARKGDSEILHVDARIVIEGGGRYKGYDYFITFTLGGTRCGHVALHTKLPYIDDLDVHGGIIFLGNKHNPMHLLLSTFYEECEELWVGFHASHYGDLRDWNLSEKYFRCSAARRRATDINYPLPYFEGASHKTFDYMENECLRLIDQIIGKELMELKKKCAQDLLTRLSNSLNDRETNKIEICFSIKEIEVVKKWLSDTLWEFFSIDLEDYER